MEGKGKKGVGKKRGRRKIGWAGKGGESGRREGTGEKRKGREVSEGTTGRKWEGKYRPPPVISKSRRL